MNSTSTPLARSYRNYSKVKAPAVPWHLPTARPLGNAWHCVEDVPSPPGQV